MHQSMQRLGYPFRKEKNYRHPRGLDGPMADVCREPTPWAKSTHQVPSRYISPLFLPIRVHKSLILPSNETCYNVHHLLADAHDIRGGGLAFACHFPCPSIEETVASKNTTKKERNR